MKAIPYPAPRGGQWLTILVLAAFWLRALVPAGYMPDPASLSSGGWAGFSLCRAGLTAGTADQDGPLILHGGDHCLFAAMSSLPALAGPALRQPLQWVLSIVAMVAVRCPPFSVTLWVPPARGPPGL
ncbi:hypothetical protein GE253_19170 [Niveispirillum sp. SYP-B3756]|uniref:hypothetical protein n=1 Tax=Niveispirillum sp. SYP-B3756 TaxID=2662178 RepID=UPI001292999E|nr:hypothetical protein [Niveispirillum sp. SYP-B3756]MQP67452.1 hypothetical protein [Niveispirillum sp. SYP-B3756]